MSLHHKFQDEAEFRDQFVKPLLNRLGFHGVAEQHGPMEFGKDFVFSDFHRLGNVRHYAAQVKHEAKITQGRPVEDLLTQIRQAFAKPFKRADSPRDCHVCAVYIFNDGEITAIAQEYLLSSLEREKFGDNVHFFDGERLQALNEWAMYQADDDARLRLLGLKGQLELNIWLWNQWGAHIGATGHPIKSPILDGRLSLLHGIEEYLTRPLSGEPIALETIRNLWLGIRMLDASRSRAYLGYATAAEKMEDLVVIPELAKHLTQESESLVRQIDKILQTKFRPIE